MSSHSYSSTLAEVVAVLGAPSTITANIEMMTRPMREMTAALGGDQTRAFFEASRLGAQASPLRHYTEQASVISAAIPRDIFTALPSLHASASIAAAAQSMHAAAIPKDLYVMAQEVARYVQSSGLTKKQLSALQVVLTKEATQPEPSTAVAAIETERRVPAATGLMALVGSREFGNAVLVLTLVYLIITWVINQVEAASHQPITPAELQQIIENALRAVSPHGHR